MFILEIRDWTLCCQHWVNFLVPVPELVSATPEPAKIGAILCVPDDGFNV